MDAASGQRQAVWSAVLLYSMQLVLQSLAHDAVVIVHAS
jgi:hypothetical protein